MRRKWERKESERKENREENIIPPLAWMEEGKQRGNKMGMCQND